MLVQEAWAGLALQRLEEGRCPEALECARRVLALEPWSERAVRTGMLACRAMGDIASALHLYRQIEKTLREELDLAPHPDLQALADSMIELAGQ
jgi:DNA-binding SARP family transcriptional activator